MWSPDGKRIYYFADDNRIMAVSFDDATGNSEPSLVTEFPDPVSLCAVKPDESFVVVFTPAGKWPPNRVISDWQRLLKEK